MADDSAKGEKKKRKSKKSKDEKPAEPAEEPVPEAPKKEPAADEESAEASPPAEEKTEPEPSPAPEHHDEQHKPEKSSALEKIEELLNPSLRIPETVGPYTVPEAVQAGDVNALRDLDEKKVIELQEAFALFDADSDGCISEEDLKSTFVALGKDPSEDIIQAMLLEAMSPLDFDAFVALMGYKCIELDPEDVLLEAWSKWDVNGTGVIPEEKIYHDLITYGERFSKDEARHALEQAPLAKPKTLDEPPMIDYQAFCRTLGGLRKRK